MARHAGTVKNNRFVPDDPDLFRKDFQERNDKKVCVIVKYEHETPTEIKYFYGAIIEPISRYMKKQPHETVAFFQGLFLPTVEVYGNWIVPSVRQISELKKQEMAEFINQIKDFVRKLNLIID
jgi:hypothetical protein